MTMTIEVTAPVSDKPVTCGVSDYVRSLAESLEQREGIDFKVTALETARPFAFIGTLVRQLRAGGVVHLNLPIEGWGNSLLPGMVLLLTRLLTRRGKIVLTLHEWKSLNLLRFLSQLPDLWTADQVVLVSREQWQAFRASKSPPMSMRDAAALIPIGANVRGEAPPAQPERRTDRDGIVIGYFGVLYAAKQPELMLQTVAALKQRGSQVRLLVAGDFLPDRPQDKVQFFNRAAELGIAQNLDFRGRIEASADVLAALAEADVQMLLFADGASARRSSLLTALQLDRPVVTTQPLLADEFQDWPDIEKQMGDGAIACVAPDAGPELVAEAVLRTVADHPSRLRIDSATVWARAGEDHAKLYEALIAGTARQVPQKPYPAGTARSIIGRT
jgi:glycosyltransferase involved in cell wall biosynthesis